jgi:predicted acetyltransferase
MELPDEGAVRAAQKELARDGFDFAFIRADEDWPSFLARTEGERLGHALPEGWVASTFLLAVVAEDVVGRVSVRHQLNPFLLAEGGHIGYGVRPAFRRWGYGSSILRQSLLVATSVGLTRVLVTCDDDNAASARIIEGAGGRLENVVGPDGQRKCRYWIDLPGAGRPTFPSMQ